MRCLVPCYAVQYIAADAHPHLHICLHIIWCTLCFQVIKEQPSNTPVLLAGRDIEVPAGIKIARANLAVVSMQPTATIAVIMMPLSHQTQTVVLYV
jgi:hypothetical protein